jgi:hypothetical protein
MSSPSEQRPQGFSYPALIAFNDDPGRTYARWCVYMALQPPILEFGARKEMKVSVVRALSRVSTRSVVDALAWLESRGYIVVHGRDRRGTPSLSLAWALPVEGETRTEAAS